MYGTVEMVGVALSDRNSEMGILFLFLNKKKSFTSHQFDLVQGIGNLLATAGANTLANEKIVRQLEEINAYKQRLEDQNLYLRKQIKIQYNYGEIIGSGEAMQGVHSIVASGCKRIGEYN